MKGRETVEIAHAAGKEIEMGLRGAAKRPVGQPSPAGRSRRDRRQLVLPEASAHLALLRVTAAAEAMLGELDHAVTADLSHQAFLQRLLAVGTGMLPRQPAASGGRCPRGSREPGS
jgi:hypothetical protein